MNTVNILIKRLNPTSRLPTYANNGDAGADLTAGEDRMLVPGERALIPTGVALALPPGYAALVLPRSGLAAHHGITVVNAPGLIDSGYRGEIMVTLLNTDKNEAFQVKQGDRIAQLMVKKYTHALFEEVQELPDSERGSAGFGSSGGFGAT